VLSKESPRASIIIVVSWIYGLSYPSVWPRPSGRRQRCACDVAFPNPRRAGVRAVPRGEEQPADPPVFFLKDNNRASQPPARAAAGPRKAQGFPLRHDAATALILWTAAIEKARSLWATSGGCVKATPPAPSATPTSTSESFWRESNPALRGGRRPGEIPVPTDGTGMWVTPGRLQAPRALNEQITETVLLR